VLPDRAVGPLLSSGRDADVYALGGARVLRRYRDGGDVAEETAVMAHVRSHGFPVPEVYGAGGSDLVMERLTGPTLLRSLLDGGYPGGAAGELLADLHTRLHAVPPRRSGNPGDRVLHLDLHPDNVILTAGGPVLIDWRNAVDGPPDLDVALTTEPSRTGVPTRTSPPTRQAASPRRRQPYARWRAPAHDLVVGEHVQDAMRGDRPRALDQAAGVLNCVRRPVCPTDCGSPPAPHGDLLATAPVRT
jgi:aminoglycoside phosphotransferase (APT) family kinase protein